MPILKTPPGSGGTRGPKDAKGSRGPHEPGGPHGSNGPRGESIDRIFNALGDPTRRELLEMLTGKPVSLSQLAGPLQISLPAVVQHVQVLEAGGLVRTVKIGRVRTCQIDTAGFSLAQQWMDARRSLWEKRLDRLGDLLGEVE
ncbi:MAG: metalloregulator ArsR/SmtB family transcription factor [Fibrobacteria bacterium]